MFIYLNLFELFKENIFKENLKSYFKALLQTLSPVLELFPFRKEAISEGGTVRPKSDIDNFSFRSLQIPTTPLVNLYIQGVDPFIMDNGRTV